MFPWCPDNLNYTSLFVFRFVSHLVWLFEDLPCTAIQIPSAQVVFLLPEIHGQRSVLTMLATVHNAIQLT